MHYAPNVRFCEVLVNGEYEGVYLMVETITDSDIGRLNLSMEAKRQKGIGYLLRVDRPTEEDFESMRDIFTYNERMLNVGTDYTIRYPGRANLTPEIARSIELDYSQFEKALFSYDYDTEQFGYQNWIDVDNFVDYYLINEFVHNSDAGKYSTYIYKEVGQKYRLCVWDFNNSMDNYQSRVTRPDAFGAVDLGWFYMLFKDEKFVQKVIDRYRELRGSYFSEEYLMNYIDDTLTYLGPAVDRNSERWAEAISDWNALEPTRRNIRSQEEGVQQNKDFLQQRGEWMDDNIEALKQYGHTSHNKAFNH